LTSFKDKKLIVNKNLDLPDEIIQWAIHSSKVFLMKSWHNYVALTGWKILNADMLTVNHHMSALTDRKKREIDEQLAKMKREAEKKALLNVICDIKNINDGPIISQRILKDIYKIYSVESASFIYGTDTVTVLAKWNEALHIIEKIKKLPQVLDVKGRALYPLWT
jgi:hypothetical protein